jgi:hypothetical protein
MTEELLRRLFWRVVDELDYLLTLARLRILDALAGPEPETPADRQRQRARERIERVRSPSSTSEGPGAAIPHRTDHNSDRTCGPEATQRRKPHC